MKRCFVISPIGADGSPIREHADDVFDYIIAPAMKECGIEPFRSDHLREPGRISEQMFSAILKDDLCIALLTGFNPNVFYELAIAQAAARPVIILLEKGNTLPFDIQDLRCVYYDLKPRSLFEKVPVNAIIEHVKALDASGWKGSNLIPGLAPLGGHLEQEQSGKLFARSKDFGGPEAWLGMLQQAETVLDVMGCSLDSWRVNKGFGEILFQKATNGCKARILIMHPDNPVLRHMYDERILAPNRDSLETELHKLSVSTPYFFNLAKQHPNIVVRQIVRGCLHLGFQRNDHYALLTQRFNAERTGYSPLWHVSAKSPLYQVGVREFDLLWRLNEATG